MNGRPEGAAPHAMEAGSHAASGVSFGRAAPHAIEAGPARHALGGQARAAPYAMEAGDAGGGRHELDRPHRLGPQRDRLGRSMDRLSPRASVGAARIGVAQMDVGRALRG